MHEQDKALLQSLVAVAWADGKFETSETEMLEALLSAFHASDAESKELRAYAAVKRSLGDMPLAGMSLDDRKALLNHSVVLTFIDGDQDESERQFIGELATKLEFDPGEADRIIAAGTTRAQRLLAVLRG